MALHLHEFEGANSLFVGERVMLMRGEVAFDGIKAVIEDNVNVGIAGSPDIFEEQVSGFFGERGKGIAQLIEGFAERSAPELIPAGLAAIAAAVRAPALDAVVATPGGVVVDFSFPLRRKL